MSTEGLPPTFPGSPPSPPPKPGLWWLPSLMLPCLLLLAAIDYTAWAYWWGLMADLSLLLPAALLIALASGPPHLIVQFTHQLTELA